MFEYIFRIDYTDGTFAIDSVYATSIQDAMRGIRTEAAQGQAWINAGIRWEPTLLALRDTAKQEALAF